MELRLALWWWCGGLGGSELPKGIWAHVLLYMQGAVLANPSDSQLRPPSGQDISCWLYSAMAAEGIILFCFHDGVEAANISCSDSSDREVFQARFYVVSCCLPAQIKKKVLVIKRIGWMVVPRPRIRRELEMVL